MATTYTLNSQSYDGRYLKLSLTQTKDIATNTSTINWTLTSTGGNSNYYDTGKTTVKINSITVYEKERVAWSKKVFPAAKGSESGSLVVSHNSDGTLTVPVSITTAIYSATLETKSGSWILDSNPRQANLVTAPNFNDEENPTVTYSNPAGNSVDSLQVCITLEGNNADVAYRDVSKTGTSYTFNLTDAERTVLRAATTGSNSRTVKFYLKTVIGGVTYYSKSGAKTFTIINGAPTLNPTVKDVHGGMLGLTGDENKFVKYYSNAQYSIGATAQKDATIVSQKVVCGAKTATAASGLIEDVESATFTFSVTDNRGNTTTKTLTKTLVNYVKLTCNLRVEPPTTSGETTIKITGNYFNNSFGASSNTLKVWYRIKEGNGDYSEWYGLTATLSNNTFTATKQLTGLDYQKYYTVQAAAQDVITAMGVNYIYSTEVKVKTLPVFDWGESDFNFNVPVKFGNINTIRRTDLGNTIIASENGDGIYLRPNGTNEGDGQVVVYSDGRLTAGGYNLTGLAKAMSNVYTLSTTTTACTNYSISNSYDAVLIGNSLRCRFYAERSAAVNGNILNEDVVTITIKHGGKIKAVYIDGITTVNQGAVANFFPDNITYDTDNNTVTFTIVLSATGSECSQFGSYFALPCQLNLNAY